MYVSNFYAFVLGDPGQRDRGLVEVDGVPNRAGAEILAD